MNTKTIIVSLIAIIILGWVLVKGLATAWVGLKLLPAVGIVLAFVVIGWLWGRLSK